MDGATMYGEESPPPPDFTEPACSSGSSSVGSKGLLALVPLRPAVGVSRPGKTVGALRSPMPVSRANSEERTVSRVA